MLNRSLPASEPTPQALAAALCAVAIAIAPSPAMARPDQGSDTALLRSYTQQLLDAVGTGDKPVWEKLLSPKFIGMDEEGHVRRKSELIGELQPLPPGLTGQLKVDQFNAVFNGDVAISVHEDQEQLSYYGQQVHSRYRNVDTWQRTPAGWRLLGQHTTAVLKDPPALPARWSGKCEYEGRYRLTDAIEVTVHCAPTGLVVSRAGRPDTSYAMEIADVFFSPGHPRTRRIFQRSPDGSIDGFVDRREGEDIRWRKIAGG